MQSLPDSLMSEYCFALAWPMATLCDYATVNRLETKTRNTNSRIHSLYSSGSVFRCITAVVPSDFAYLGGKDFEAW